MDNYKIGNTIIIQPYTHLNEVYPDEFNFSHIYDSEQIGIISNIKLVHEYNCYYIEILVKGILYYINIEFGEKIPWRLIDAGEEE